MEKSLLGLRFPKECIPGSYKAIKPRRVEGSLDWGPLSCIHWWCHCHDFGPCWLLPKRASGCPVNWKHTLQLQPRRATFPQMVLVLWFSMWVIWLIATSFLSQTPPGKFGSLLIWGGILGSAAKAAGLRLLVREVEMMETCCGLLDRRGTGGVMLRNQILASKGFLSYRQFWNSHRTMLCYYITKN